MMNHRVTDKTIQLLLLKRFALAACTYLLVMALVWVAIFSGYYRSSGLSALVASILVLVSQGALAAFFLTGANQRFKDPSLTEPQVLLGIAWETLLLSQLDSARGTFLTLYVLVLLFGLFHLPFKVFARCAVIALLGFAGLNLIEVWRHRLPDPGLAAVQTFALFIVLFWLCLYARFVQGSRHRMHQRRVTLQAHQETLRGMMFQLEELASTDELTSLFNRRHFLRMASRELEFMDGSYTEGLALIDLDHFKRVNDLHGHAAGDQVLQLFAAIASNCLRSDDVLARYGGEEFVLLIPRCTRAQLVECCERIRLAFAQVEIVELPGIELSLSIGMTGLERGDDLDRALQRADQALYRAKHRGRNRCCGAWEYADA